MTFPDPRPAAHETAAIVHQPVPLAPVQPAPLLPALVIRAVPVSKVSVKAWPSSRFSAVGS